MHPYRRYIPSLFTVLSLFAGFLAILQIIHGQQLAAIMLVLAAAVFDTLDGKIARWINVESQFGQEMDSMADMVSFCIAPTVMVYVLFLQELGIVGALIGFLPVLLGAARLVQFNLKSFQRKPKEFIGLPTTSNGILIVAYLWFHYRIFGAYGEARIVLPLMILLAFLMISPIPFSRPPSLSFRKGREEAVRSGVFILALIVFVTFPAVTIFPGLLLYVVTHILMWLVNTEEQFETNISRKE